MPTVAPGNPRAISGADQRPNHLNLIRARQIDNNGLLGEILISVTAIETAISGGREPDKVAPADQGKGCVTVEIAMLQDATSDLLNRIRVSLNEIESVIF